VASSNVEQMPSLMSASLTLIVSQLEPRTPKRSSLIQNTAKRRKYQHICESRPESFHPFVASTDGMLAPEATKILQHLADLMANKQQQTYSAIMKHLRLRIGITLVKAFHHCLRGSRKTHQQPSSRFATQNPVEPSSEYRMLYS
jgi:hypothetical protein